MKSIDLIKSFKKQCSWGQNADDGRPYRGFKWLTVKQINFLRSLVYKEDPKLMEYFNVLTWKIDGYEASLGKVHSNGCRQILFTNTVAK